MESKTKMADIRQEMKCFIEGTSLKGAPRIMKSPNCFMRVFWIIIVVFLLATTVGFTTILILDYLKYPIVINIAEYMMLNNSDRKELIDRYDYTFPSVTVCNLNPYRSDFLDFAPPGMLSDSEFFHLATSQMRGLDVPEIVWQDFSAFGYYTYMANTAIFYQYNFHFMSQPFDEFFDSCSFLTDVDPKNESLACADSALIREWLLPHTTTCYIIEFQDSDKLKRNQINGLSMILYLDNFSEFVPMSHFDYSDNFRKQAGVEIVTHTANTYPQPFDESSKFPPGRNVELKLTPSAVKRLPEPYGDCDEKGRRLYYLFGEDNTYSQKGCINACVQEFITNDCHCIYPATFLSFKKNRGMELMARIPFCHTYDLQNVSITFDRVLCAQQTIFREQQRCFDECKPNCTEIQFTHSFTAAQWPTKNTQLAFYNTAIAGPSTNANSTRRQKFEPTFEAINEAVSNGNNTHAINLLKSTSLIDDNFLKVTIKLDEKNVVAFESQPKITPVQFMSLLGGTLNLYAGITFVVLFELLELAIKIGYNFVRKLKAKNKITPVKVFSEKNRKILKPHF